MNEEPTDAVISFTDWIIPLDEPAVLPFLPSMSLSADTPLTPELLQFPTDLEAYPTEGHHPRLLRFGRVA